MLERERLRIMFLAKKPSKSNLGTNVMRTPNNVYPKYIQNRFYYT